MSELHIIDGGLSTELTRLGAVIGGELWTGRALLEDPALVEQAHRNYAEAGAEIVITSSYQLSRQGFREVGLTDADADRALAVSVEVARRGVQGTNAKVAASVGPYGAVLHDGSEYRGDYKVDQAFLEDFHHERISVLAAAEPDYFAVETIPNVLEAKALANVLSKSKIPAWISFTAKSETELWSGEPIQAAVAEILGINSLVAVGVNCVAPEHVVGLLTAISTVTDLPKIAYPNRGGTWDSAAGKWIGDAPIEFAAWLPSWRAAGANFIGGCCGTNALEIASLRTAVS